MIFYKANQSYNANLTSDYTVSDNALGVNSVPTNTPTIVTVARGTAKETRFYVTGTSGGNQLTGVTRLDGANENIPSGSSVECMNDADFINQLASVVFDQVGLKGLIYAADGGSDDDYEITLSVEPSSLSDLVGVPIAFKANTANTGAATLAVNGLTAKTIKKLHDQDLETGDIESGQIVVVIYDGTNFQLQSESKKATAVVVGIMVVDPTTDVAIGDGKAYFRIPAALNGFNLVGVAATSYTAGTTGTEDIQIRNKTQAADMLSTKITIDSSETDSSTAAAPPVIDAANDDVATGDVLAVDVDAVQTTKAKGLYIEMKFELP